MLSEILSCNNVNSFIALAASFGNSNVRSHLYEEINQASLVLSLDALWTDDSVERFSVSYVALESALNVTATEPESVRLAHRLQLIGQCNASATAAVEKFLNKACV